VLLHGLRLARDDDAVDLDLASDRAAARRVTVDAQRHLVFLTRFEAQVPRGEHAALLRDGIERGAGRILDADAARLDVDERAQLYVVRSIRAPVLEVPDSEHDQRDDDGDRTEGSPPLLVRHGATVQRCPRRERTTKKPALAARLAVEPARNRSSMH